MMKKLVETFPEQLAEALEIGRSANIRMGEHPIHNVFIAGMGGSGIGGNFVEAIAREECPVPISVGKGYDIPKYVNENTLCITSSYSGNTEETLSAFEQMLKTGAKIVCVSSGGKLIEMAKKNKLDFIQLPGGKPSPRACLGYSFVQQLWILRKLNLISETSLLGVSESIKLLQNQQEDIKSRARKIAESLKDKIPVIYTSDKFEPVALRFRQQLNENAKMLAWHQVVPEMNHNELVGWQTKDNRLAVIWLRDDHEFGRTAVRMVITKEIVAKYAVPVLEIFSKGKSFVDRAMYLVHLVDWASVYLAELRGVDVMEIKVIDFLKRELAKV